MDTNLRNVNTGVNSVDAQYHALLKNVNIMRYKINIVEKLRIIQFS